MSYHVTEHCKLPKFWKSRWKNRLWVCTCGRLWRVRSFCAMDGCVWGWELWKPPPREEM